MSIDWSAFWEVAGVSLAFGLGITVLFSLGVMGLSMSRGEVADQADRADGATSARGGRGAGSILAGTCFVLCVAAVAYGLYLEIPQFH